MDISKGLFTVIILAGFLTACSSDSGGGGTPSAAYAGLTTPASVSASNGQEISEAVMDGASGANASASASADQNVDNEQLIGAMRRIRSVVVNSDKTRITSSGSGLAATTSASDTIESSCGGSVTYSFSYDDATGKFTGSYNFNNYVDCTDNSKMNGSMTVSGTLNLNTFDIPTMTATFTALTYTDASESMTMTGDMTYQLLSASSYKATMNMDFRDENANKTYRVVNYIVLATTDFSTYEDVDLSGKFYHPDYGYVTLSTTTLLHISFPDENPSSGVLELVGSGNTKAILTMTSNDTYTLEIDENGDSVVDVTKSCTWSTNTCN